MKHFTEWMEEGLYTSRGITFSKRLLLKDRTSFSIQAGYGNYCLPKLSFFQKKLSYAAYTHFEIGFPNKEIPEIFEYAENEENYLNTVYWYVPKEEIEALIEKRGGVLGYDYSNVDEHLLNEETSCDKIKFLIEDSFRASIFPNTCMDAFEKNMKTFLEYILVTNKIIYESLEIAFRERSTDITVTLENKKCCHVEIPILQANKN